jgi:hypothetical protein
MGFDKYNKGRKSQKADKDALTVALTINICKSTRALLDTKCRETGFHLKKLIAIAIDNELDAANPFNYPAELPETEYKEDDYIEEAVKIFDLIKKHGSIDKEYLLLSRRDVGIENKSAFLHGLRELFERQQVEIDDTKQPAFKNYPEGYVRIRIKK